MADRDMIKSRDGSDQREEDQRRVEEAMDRAEEVDESAEEADEDEEERPRAQRGAAGAAVAAVRPGFFTIHKSGQGYWTRVCTAGAVALVVLTIASFFYQEMRTWRVFLDAAGRPKTGLILGILGGCVAAIGLWAFRIMNKPRIVEFLVATESEMKKVNWTTRKELIGSTKVVIFFMFLISLILFVIDIIFGYFFLFIRVLEFGPFGTL